MRLTDRERRVIAEHERLHLELLAARGRVSPDGLTSGLAAIAAFERGESDQVGAFGGWNMAADHPADAALPKVLVVGDLADREVVAAAVRERGWTLLIPDEPVPEPARLLDLPDAAALARELTVSTYRGGPSAIRGGQRRKKNRRVEHRKRR